MTRTLALALILASAVPALAQVEGADPALLTAQREAMARLAWMDGRWRGEAVTQGAQGPLRIIQTERVGGFLDGTVKVIEGKGFVADGRPGFNALGIISYDPQTKRYEMRSYAQGRGGAFAITPTANGFAWDIPAGPMTIHYTATFKEGVWTEIGERVTPGQPPVRFFEMNLRRVGDTDWPAAGGMTPR